MRSTSRSLRHATGYSLSWNQTLLSFAIILMLFVSFQLAYMKIRPARKFYHMTDHNVRRATGYPDDSMPNVEPNSPLWDDGYHLLYSIEISSQILSNSCRALSPWDRLRDPDCHAQWVNHLKYAKIVDVDLMLGFEKGKRNAFRVVFEDGTYGWYKTCPGEGEDPEKEVVGYLIDHFLKFHTMAPAVYRELNIKDLEDLLHGNDEYLELIAQTDYVCSSGGKFPGVMIGWWEDLEETRSPIKKKHADLNETLTVRNNWEEHIENDEYPILDMPRNHVLLYLLNILQHQGHNEFRLKNGPLVCIDVDRAEFTHPPSSSTGFGLEQLCKVDYNTLVTLRHMSGFSTSPGSLSVMIAKALDKFAPEIPFTRDEASILQLRITKLISYFDTCIGEYGLDDVVF